MSGEFASCKGYSGFALLPSQTVTDALKAAREDGVTKLLVVNQEVVFSNTSAGVVMDQVRTWLANNDWQGVKVIAVKSYARDPRYLNYIIARMEAQLRKRFSDKDNSDICVLIAGPGYPQFAPGTGGISGGVKNTAAADAVWMAEKLQDHFKANYDTRMGFSEDKYDAEGVHAHWTQPSDMHAAHEVANSACKNVYITGQAATTVDNLQTLYQEAIVLRGAILRVAPTKDVFVDTASNMDHDFINYFRDMLLDATMGKGDVEFIR